MRICIYKTKLDRSPEPQQERSRESLRRLLQAAAEALGQHGLTGATIPINAMLGSYRSKAGLLRAVRQFVQDRQGTTFGKKVTRLEVRSMPQPISKPAGFAR